MISYTSKVGITNWISKLDIFKYHSKISLWILLTCLVPGQLLAQQQTTISAIQGDGPTSPLVNMQVTTVPVVVTWVGSDRFYVQSRPSDEDNNDNTSEGLLVVSGTSPGVSTGQLVRITGTIRESDAMTRFSTGGLSIDPLGSSSDLPEKVELTEELFSSLYAGWEALEGMRVRLEATIGGPAGSYDDAAMYVGDQRPFREPGLEVSGPTGIPVWDGNPELLWFDPDILGAPNNRFLSYPMQVGMEEAIMTQDGDRYYPVSSTYTIDSTVLVRPVPQKMADQVSIGSINLLRLIKSADDYEARLRKSARYVISQLGSPDILATQEVGGQRELSDLANMIRQLNSGTNYRVLIRESSGDISVGYLVKDWIETATVKQLGKTELISIGGVLHDRPPLLLEAVIPTTPPTPLSILNLHLRSRNGIDGSNPTFARTKRYEQAVSIARMVQARKDENLVLIGDFNAFQFTDGVVDVLAQISGTTPGQQQFPYLDIVEDPLTNLALELPQDDQYSYVYQGNAQILDHALVNSLPDLEAEGMAYARGNADAATAYMSNEFLVQRTSDHDGLVIYLKPDNPLVSQQEINVSGPAITLYPNPTHSTLQVKRADQQPLGQWTLYSTSGELIQKGKCPYQDCTIELLPSLLPGSYQLHGMSKDGQWTRTVVIR